MHSILGFLSTVILFLATGCAAPLTQVVATRQDGIGQQHFKEDEEVWITYKDEGDTLRKARGRVVHTDSSSVRLSQWGKDPVDIGYRRINTLSRPVKDLWFMGISTGRFWAPAVLLGDTYPDRFTTWVGLSPRYAPHSNVALEANVLMGRGGRESSTWIGTTLNTHWYTIISRTYLFFGGGLIWHKPTEEYKTYLSRFDKEPRSFFVLYRWGFGLTNPISQAFNIRLEAETGISGYVGEEDGGLKKHAPMLGLRAYLERRIR